MSLTKVELFLPRLEHDHTLLDVEIELFVFLTKVKEDGASSASDQTVLLLGKNLNPASVRSKVEAGPDRIVQNGMPWCVRVLLFAPDAR